MNASRLFPVRITVFVLASTSFACLLGQFYHWWGMQSFGCWVLLPAAGGLVCLGYHTRVTRGEGMRSPFNWLVHGTMGGVIAALVYDLYRLPFVLGGTPLFQVFPRFGELLLGGTEPRWAVHTLGWAYHFSNGAALGVMFLSVVGQFQRPPLFFGAVVWAALVEVLLLLTPYPAFLGFTVDGLFLFLTASAHLVFGVTLGTYCHWRFAPPGDLAAAAT